MRRGEIRRAELERGEKLEGGRIRRKGQIRRRGEIRRGKLRGEKLGRGAN